MLSNTMNNLLKEASDLIADLSNELSVARETTTSLQSEITNLKSEIRRQKLASELDKKGLTSYDELSRINKMSDEELDNLEKLSSLDVSFTTERYTPNLEIQEPTYHTDTESESYRSRTQYLKENLIIN